MLAFLYYIVHMTCAIVMYLLSYLLTYSSRGSQLLNYGHYQPHFLDLASPPCSKPAYHMRIRSNSARVYHALVTNVVADL